MHPWSRALSSLPSSHCSMKSRASAAEGQYLGYSLQLSRLLALLLEGRVGDSVCLEVFGDTAVVANASVKLSEELKSRTSTDNPIRNRAVDLWKMLRNWLDLTDDGVDPTRTEFRLHTTRPFPSDWAARFAKATEREECAAVIGDVLQSFEKEPPGTQLKKYTDPVLARSRQDALLRSHSVAVLRRVCGCDA